MINIEELRNDIKKYGLLPSWLKNETEENIDTELSMSEFFEKDNGIILIKPPIGWSWTIKKNY